MPLTPPDAPLTDGTVVLRPLTEADLPGFELLAADATSRRFTRVPEDPPAGFAAKWLSRYVNGWTEGTLAGFAIGLTDSGDWAGWAGVVNYDAAAAEGELGYMIAPDARGRGVATRTLRLLTEWALGPAQLQRSELVIDVDNAPSLVVARRAGYRREGVRRSTHVKDDVRADVEIWSRLPSDPSDPSDPSEPAG